MSIDTETGLVVAEHSSTTPTAGSIVPSDVPDNRMMTTIYGDRRRALICAARPAGTGSDVGL